MADEPTPPGNPLGDAGDCPAVEWKGTTYRLGHPTQAAKYRYCEALIDAEKAGFDAQLARGWIDQRKYEDKLDALGGVVDRLEHHPGGPLWQEYALGEKVAAGLSLFVWSLFRENHPDITAQAVREMQAGCPALLRLAVRRVTPSFFDWVAEAMGAPRDKVAEAVAPLMAQAEAALAQLGGED